jgi:hypothetical protein
MTSITVQILYEDVGSVGLRSETVVDIVDVRIGDAQTLHVVRVPTVRVCC